MVKFIFRRKTTIALCFFCAAWLLWSPGVTFAQHYSAAYCQSFARDVSLYHSRGGAIGGAARGALGGAAIGAIVGGGRGAGRGAGVGAIVGGVSRGVQRSISYDQAYRDCMRGYVSHY